jgi:hypothetical protein
MCLSALLSIDATHTELTKHCLPVYTKLLNRACDTINFNQNNKEASFVLSNHSIASICFYSRNLTYRQSGIENFLNSLSDIIRKSYDTNNINISNKRITNQELAMIFLGLRGKYSPIFSQELHALLGNIFSVALSNSDKHNEKWNPIDGLTVALGIYGLSSVNLKYHSEIIDRFLRWFAINLR